MGDDFNRRRGFIIILAIVSMCFVITASGQQTQTETKVVTVEMTLEPLVTFNYNGGDAGLGQVAEDPFRYTTYYNSYPNIEVRTKLSSWQLQVGMSDGGKLIHDDDHTKTTNPLKVYLKKVWDNDNEIVSSWQEGTSGSVYCNMVTMDNNNAATSYFMHPKYDIVTTLADPGGHYTGTVTWTLILPLQGG